MSPPRPPQEGTDTCSHSPRKGGRDGQLVHWGQLRELVWHGRQGCCPRGGMPTAGPSARPGAAGRHWLRRAGRGSPASVGSRRRARPGPAPLQQAAAAERPRRAGQCRARRDRAGPGRRAPRRAPRRPLAAAGRMIGVNSINSSAGRMRSRSMCSVRYGRNYRGVETFCYGWPQRSRTLKPVLYTDLVVSRIQSRRKKKPVSGGSGERGAPPGDAQRPAPRRGQGRVHVPGQSPSRPLREPQPWYGCSEQPAPSPVCFLWSRVSAMSPPPESPRPQPWIFPPRHPTPITGVAGARQDLSDIAPLTVVWQQCLLENIAARGIQDRAVPLGPALRLSVSDRLCGLSARGCIAPCPGQPSQGRLAPT